MEDDDQSGQSPEQSLGRTQRRLLRRVFNGRTVPVVVDDKPFLTYKEAARYLLSLPVEERDAAYDAMKVFADRKGESQAD
ncbi:hypothetical protein WBP06_10580 [Novosphingobium sp. BL-8H]|uniref:hypothetical protein n=1 Tax=Novosphingobium sp. BL-8H TaxID=3127640 RepID=UPI003756D586